MYWVILPMIYVMTLAIHYNSSVPGWLRLYPLIFLSAAGIVFTFVFLFRYLEISYSEIRYIGRFSSRDSALINEGKSLIIYREAHGRIKIYLFGNDGLPELDWMRDQTTCENEICMFRGKCWGGERTVRKILRSFGVDESDLPVILNSERFNVAYENVSVEVYPDLDERTAIRIRIDKTI